MNPEELESLGSVRSGEFVAQFIEPLDESEELADEAVQPNGVDLSVGELFRLRGEGRISNDEYEKPTRETVHLLSSGEYKVEPEGSYIIVYDEQITIPENHIGLVFPRSRLMRCGLHVETAVWDSGYSGVGEGQLVTNQPALLDEDLRVAQMIFIRTESLADHYDGSHQGERL